MRDWIESLSNELLAIEADGLSEAPQWNVNNHISSLSNPSTEVLLMLVDSRQNTSFVHYPKESVGSEHFSRIQGFVYLLRTPYQWEILQCAVRTKGKGLGLILFQELIRRAQTEKVQELWLEYSERNKAAQRLYEKLGFSLKGSRPAYYRDSSAAHLMSLSLKDRVE